MTITAPRITPFLWLEGRAREASDFYVAVFGAVGDARITEATTFNQGPAAGSDMVSFLLDGQPFIAFDGHPAYPFTPAVSFVVNCETQAEIDHFWQCLSEDGQPGPCGWLQDKFGVSWQIIPAILPALMRDEAKSSAALEALLQMSKPDIRQIQDACDRG